MTATAVAPCILRDRLRLAGLIGIADRAHDERRAEARQAALRAYHRHEPECVFELRLQRAMLTGEPFYTGEF